MHLFPTVIAKANSPYSGNIKVIEGLGFRHLSTDGIQHSGGIVKEIWQTALKPVGKNNKNWLVLGVAGGSVIKLISKIYRPKNITGVDIDPVIVEMGKKYFDLDKTPNLKLIIADGEGYLQTTNDFYDYILVDLFGKNSCPDFVYQNKFIKKLEEKGNTIIINHLYHTPTAVKAAKKLENILNGYTARKILRNIIYSKTK